MRRGPKPMHIPQNSYSENIVVGKDKYRVVHKDGDVTFAVLEIKPNIYAGMVQRFINGIMIKHGTAKRTATHAY